VNHYRKNTPETTLEPQRALRTDFTAYTIKHATVAKQRARKKERFGALFKEPFSMKSLAFLRTAPGMLVASAVIATTGASAYALTNWFNGSIGIKQDNSILSVDLSSCKGTLPGFDNTDRHNVQFKILDGAHISATDLQQKLLAECEYQAVLSFFRGQPTTASSAIYTATALAVTNNSLSISYKWAGTTHEKTLSLAQNLTVYDQGHPTMLTSLRAGDSIVFATSTQPVVIKNGQPVPLEGAEPFSAVNEVQSIFKTHYDTTTALSASKNGFYEDNHIMPLDMYRHLHK